MCEGVNLQVQVHLCFNLIVYFFYKYIYFVCLHLKVLGAVNTTLSFHSFKLWRRLVAIVTVSVVLPLILLLLLYTITLTSATVNTMNTSTEVVLQQQQLPPSTTPTNSTPATADSTAPTPPQTNPKHLSPEQSGSACLIRLRAVWRDQLVLEKKAWRNYWPISTLTPSLAHIHPGLWPVKLLLR